MAIGQSASLYKHQMKRQLCCLHVALKSFFFNVNVLISKEKFRRFYFKVEFRNKFAMSKGPKRLKQHRNTTRKSDVER